VADEAVAEAVDQIEEGIEAAQGVKGIGQPVDQIEGADRKVMAR
jgi:hypothetical protein